ncbi:hypothetical protein [Corynebacterium timonense]|uniref:Beta-N-acetylhexosaminidase n=1 Tax=Corynebacterium timonense TaxID=441500 RepID=A0A1H1RLX1_9CORY|nr:hypothetical protein [Corynebacterium timonense]SDS36698.1 hypothetical protein SAMN04488539_1535 [Corynebacterium timonense]
MHCPLPALRLAACAVLPALVLSGCSDSPDEDDATTVTSTHETTVSPSTTATVSTPATSTSASDGDDELVGEIAEHFSTLAPASLFEQLDTCTETSVDGSFDCSGPDIGQFQFFDSEAKAASTTQLLTELRSSRIVEDSGERIVGWSTLGTSAIITVVDTDKGQVMQQLISTDQEDPRQRIEELGLIDSAEPSSEPAEPAEQPAEEPAS